MLPKLFSMTADFAEARKGCAWELKELRTYFFGILDRILMQMGYQDKGL